MMARFLPKRHPCMLLVTGQTTQYASKADDGHYEKGVAKQYIILSTGNYSGTKNITINGKTHALSNNCVIDLRTGLMWARYVPDGDIGPDGDGKLFWIDDVNDEDIFDFADEANAQELGGHSDWRVPNLFELFSIVELEATSPAIDTAIFPSTPSALHWCSTTRKANTDYAYNLNFTEGGYCGYGDKDAAKNYCRLVRGGAL